MKNYVAVVYILTLLTGCAASGPLFEGVVPPDKGMTTLYVYRPNNIKLGGSYPMTIIDGKEMGYLKNGGYIRADLDPGKHKIQLRKSFNWSTTLTTDLDMERNKIYYLKLLVDVDGSIGSDHAGKAVVSHKYYRAIAFVKEAQAIKELPETRAIQ